MRHLSLCAGIAGVDIGLRRAIKDLRTVAMVEIEAFCIAHLVAKMESGELDAAPVYTDLRRFPWSKYRGCVDLVSGGFPCQPFSVSGQRRATEDPRHLWPVIKSGIAVLRPSFCFFENVDGIASAESPGYHSVLHHVLCDLEEMGFRATAGQFTAEEVGAPHLRKRWFILGMANPMFSGLEEHGQGESDSTVKPSEMADSRCNYASTRRQREAATQRSRERHGQGGSRCDAGSGYIEAARQTWPARPGEQQHKSEPPRTTQSRLGGHADGIPNRVDRLRALGNAVVPDVAAKAFTQLWHELKEINHVKT